MFLFLLGEGLDDLAIVLKILSAPDLKTLAKSFHINSQGLTKHKIVELLLKRSQQSSISTMFNGGASGNMEKTILKRFYILLNVTKYPESFMFVGMKFNVFSPKLHFVET